jgi:hypothetical protein
MRKTLRNLAVTAAVSAVVLPAAPASAVLPPSVASWWVTITGTTSGKPFIVGGTVTLHRTVTRAGTTNGVNRGDVCLQAGLPAGRPTRGAIWYGSNSACFPDGRENLDLAYVTVTGNQLTVNPDRRFQAPMTNVWVDRCSYSATSGAATYRVHTNGSLSGSLRLQGNGGASCGTSTYIATLTGVRTS